MIGNNPRELGCLSLHLRNFRWKRFSVNATFNLKEGWKIAPYFKPDYILIDGSFDSSEIKAFVQNLRSNRATSTGIIALLKEDNHQELMITGVQDYLLKDNIASDTFAFDILNALAHQQTEESHHVSLSEVANSWFPAVMFGKKPLMNH